MTITKYNRNSIILLVLIYLLSLHILFLIFALESPDRQTKCLDVENDVLMTHAENKFAVQEFSTPCS